MHGRHTPPAPLERGGLRCLFLVGSERFDGMVSPLERGLKGCVTVRGAVWAEVFLLLFGEEVFLGFGWLLLILGGCARALHTPGPSREGRFGRCFLVGNEWFIV